ncbi:MAG: sigma-54 dependent transcriptional regulator [Verrucomicrobiota bacterium]
MTFEKILIVEAEVSTRKLVEQHLRKRRYLVSCADSLAEAQDLTKREAFDLVFLALRLPDGDGFECLNQLVHDPAAPVVVVMSVYSEIDTAVRALRLGAFDSMVKPFSVEELEVVIGRAEAFGRLVEMNRYMRGELRSQGEIPGESATIRQLRTMVRKVAPTEATVLLIGESGVGKCRVAESIHSASLRSPGPLIKIDCAADQEAQLEDLLFGVDDAKSCASRLELASGGTVILREVSELSLCLQEKLLRVFQTHEFERSGSGRRVRVDVRFLATSQHDLAALVAKGQFRGDLFERLNVFPLHVPPLRSRIADIPLLVENWIDRLASRFGYKPAGISEEALRHLQAYSWPGNLSELENALGRAAILAGFGKRLEAESFGFLQIRTQTAATLSPHPPGEENEPLLTLDELEKRHVLRALEYTKQNRTRAASLLKISVRTLRNKLHQYRAEDRMTPGCRQSDLPMISAVASRPADRVSEAETPAAPDAK